MDTSSRGTRVTDEDYIGMTFWSRLYSGSTKLQVFGKIDLHLLPRFDEIIKDSCSGDPRGKDSGYIGASF